MGAHKHKRGHVRTDTLTQQITGWTAAMPPPVPLLIVYTAVLRYEPVAKMRRSETKVAAAKGIYSNTRILDGVSHPGAS